MDTWNKKSPMTRFCGELKVCEASVKESHGICLEVNCSESTISAKYFRLEKRDGKISWKEVKMFLLNSKISNLQCYCAFPQSLFQKHSSLSWKKGWLHSSATATTVYQALSKGKICHPTTRIEITDLQLWFAAVFTVCCPKYYIAPFYINFKKWT